MRRTVRFAAALALAVAGGVGCDALRESLDPSPATPPAPPPPLREGRVLLALEGKVEGTRIFSVLTSPARYEPEGSSSLVWRNDTFEVFTLDGVLTVGAQPTSEDLRVQLVLDVDGEVVGAASHDGECTVTVEHATVTALDGELTCRGLRLAGGTGRVHLDGTFEASA